MLNDSRTIGELLVEVQEATKRLEELIKEPGEVPDTPPMTSEEYHDAFDEGFSTGYGAHRHDIFIPMLVMTLAGLGGGIVIGVMI